jgi:hypothetical protein
VGDPMTDAQLVEFLGLSSYDPQPVAQFIAAMPPERRATYERMHEASIGLQLWQQGVVPKPQGVIVCRDHGRRRRQSDG